MLPDGVHLSRLSEGGDQNLGVSCTPGGLFLGGTALVERRGGGYAVRARPKIERLFGSGYGYGGGVALDEMAPRLAVVVAAQDGRNLCLAQIAALHLRLPDLPDMISRRAIEVEDAPIKAAQSDETLARADWDPAEHPRAGVPPNPGWFAPTGGSSPPLEIAQNTSRRHRFCHVLFTLAQRWSGD